MMRVALLGAAHPHVGYLLDEVAAGADVEVVVAAEPDPSARTRFLSALPHEVCTDDPMAAVERADIDVAVACGVYGARAELVVACLRRGVSVLADKPLCTSLAQLDQIEQAAADSGAVLSVMFDKRFYPETEALAAVVADGALGEIVMISSTGPHKLRRDTRPSWFFTREGYGGIANDLPVHDIDIVLRLTGARAGQVSARAGNRRLPEVAGFEDHVALLLQAGTTTATIDASWLHPEASDVHGHYRMRVIGTEGTAEVDWAYGGVTLTTHDRPARALPLPPRVRPVQFFFDALRDGREPPVTVDQALLATRIALLAQASADGGGRPIPFGAD